MKNWKFILILLFLWSQNVHSQSVFTDTVLLQEVEIPASKERPSPSQNQLKLDSHALSNSTTGNLAEVLSQNTGIFVKSYGQNSLSSVSFRGSGASHTGIYWNGFSLNSAMNGQIDLSLLPTAFYDQVLVDFGSSSMQHGTGGLGGSIQLLNTPEFRKQSQVELHQSLGSFSRLGTFAKAVVSNSKWQGSTKIYRQSAANDFEYLNLGKEAFPMEKQKNAAFLQYGIMQGLYFRPKESQVLKLDAWYMNTDRDIPSIMTVNNRKENQKDESIRLVVSFKNYYKRAELQVGSNFQHELLEYRNEMMQQHSITKTYSWKNSIKLEYRIKERLKIKSRADLDRESIASEVYSIENFRLRQGMYAAAAYEFQKTFVEAFVREEWISGEEVYLLPGFAISHQLGKGSNWQLRSSVAQNIKQPSLNDLHWIPAGNPNLKVEKSKNLEAGISNSNVFTKSAFKLDFALTAFHYDIKDYIQWLPSSFGYWRAENLKEIKSRGLELNAALQRKWSKLLVQLEGNYSYTASTNQKALQWDDESVGKQLFYVPRQLINSQLCLRRNDTWLELSHQFTGLRYTSSDNSEYLPAYNLFHLKLGKQIKIGKNSCSLEFGINNLLDKNYQAILWRPMPGRSYVGTIKYRLIK